MSLSSKSTFKIVFLGGYVFRIVFLLNYIVDYALKLSNYTSWKRLYVSNKSLIICPQHCIHSLITLHSRSVPLTLILARWFRLLFAFQLHQTKQTKIQNVTFSTVLGFFWHRRCEHNVKYFFLNYLYKKSHGHLVYNVQCTCCY